MMEQYVDLDAALGDERSTPFFERGDGLKAGTTPGPPLRIRASPFVCRSPSSIPPRRWLYGRHYVRGYTSTTVAPGGLGKTSLTLADAISMVSGRALLGGTAPKCLRVWVWNLEDPLDELERRLSAIMLHHGVNEEEIADRLFVDTGRSSPLVIGTKHRDQTIIAEPLVDELVREIREKRIDVLIIDPFVSSHNVPENDNGAIDKVAKTWARIADETGCAVELVHHVRKQASGSQAPYTVDDARGAVALIGAVRSARVLNAMSEEEAEKASISAEQRRAYFRVDDGKANMRPPIEKATWHRLVSVPLDNRTDEDEGDWVGVVTSWEMPGVFDGMTSHDLRTVQDKIATGQWAENVQAGNWAGRAVAEALDLDASTAAGKQRIKALLQTWITNKALRVEYQHSTRDGRDKPMIVVGEWA